MGNQQLVEGCGASGCSDGGPFERARFADNTYSASLAAAVPTELLLPDLPQGAARGGIGAATHAGTGTSSGGLASEAARGVGRGTAFRPMRTNTILYTGNATRRICSCGCG